MASIYLLFNNFCQAVLELELEFSGNVMKPAYLFGCHLSKSN